MARLRRRDLLALALLTPLWLVCFAASLLAVDRPVLLVPFYVDPAPGPAEAPVVRGLPPWIEHTPQPDPTPRPGDRLLRVGGIDVTGAGRQRVAGLAWARMSDDGLLAVEVEREGRRLATTSYFAGPQPKWPLLPVSFGFAAMATAGLLVAPKLRLMQVGYPALMTTAFWMAGYFGREPTELIGAFWVRSTAFVGMLPLYLRMFRFFPSSDDRHVRWARGWPILFGLNGLLIANTEFFGFVPGARSHDGTHVLMGSAAILAFAIAASNYRVSSARVRRQFRWIALGSLVSWLPTLASVSLHFVAFELGPWWLASQLATLAVPIAAGIAIWRDDLFDVDRALASLVFLILFGGAALAAIGAGVPAGTRWLAEGTGIDPQNASLLLTVGFTLSIAAAALGVRGLARRWLFRDQVTLEEEASVLMAEVSACEKLREVTALLGDRLPALWRADGSVVHAGEPGDLVPVYVGGESGSDAARLPADVEAQLRGSERPVARGDLLHLPLRRGGELAAVVALGPKRSGDIYTPHDRALLTAVADRASRVLERLEHRELLESARLLNRELAHEKDTLGRASEAKSTFLATAGHDLRQPLHAMGLFLGALEERVSDPEAVELLERVRSSARSLEQMFDGLLDVAKIDAGVLEPEVAPVPLGPLLVRLETELRPLAESRGLRLRIRPSSLAVASDALLLRSVLQNLIGNALRYTERGGVLVGARRRGGDVSLEVWDTGPGIPEGEAERLFRPGERGGAVDTEGSGLGLALVERLATVLGHGLGVRSRPGRGSVFSVRAPVARHRVRKEAGRAAPKPAFGRDVCVALLDDEPDALAGLAALLGSWGVEVIEASSADALLDAVARAGCPPDALVVDLWLAGGASGLDALDRLTDRTGRAIPALVISADTSAEAEQRVEARGLLLLRKPVEPVRLRAALAHLL